VRGGIELPESAGTFLVSQISEAFVFSGILLF